MVPALRLPLASFLLGYPDNSTIATNLLCCTFGMAQHYAFFVQDDFKVSKNLTLNYGLRYEYHPTFRDKYNNVSNIDLNHLSIVNGQTVHGAVIVPGPGTLATIDPGFAASIYPTPIVTAQSIGDPPALRYSHQDGLRAAHWIRVAHVRKRQDGSARRLRTDISRP